MKKKIKIIIFSVISIICMLCIFKLSSMNSDNSNGHSRDFISIFIEDTLNITNNYGITDSHPSSNKIQKASYLINPPLRKVCHATVYFVLSFFLMILLNIIFNYKKYFLSVIISTAICILFASSDEIHQLFVIGRTGQVIDVVIDALGSIVGIIFYTTYYIVYKRGQKSMENKKAI